ncbi:MAG TPA: hypothetical protein VE466_16775, partial [Acidimicrobiales bacterium]|nr:hypothetical protein [Acidimicrobiales bacterium]
MAGAEHWRTSRRPGAPLAAFSSSPGGLPCLVVVLASGTPDSTIRTPHSTPTTWTSAVKYVSTRGQAPVLDFADVLLAGLAADGGLYVPESWPRLPAGWQEPRP